MSLIRFWWLGCRTKELTKNKTTHLTNHIGSFVLVQLHDLFEYDEDRKYSLETI